MNKIKYIWKPVGYTPLEITEKFKEKFPEYKEVIVSYAGRLDPMAEGILILLIGNENKNRENYLGLEKEYISEIILGISTDTFDSLGLIKSVNIKEVSANKINKQLKSFLGKQKQLYPPYSSKAVDGKPLFWWARNKRLNEIEIPKREIEIYSIELLNLEKFSVQNLVKEIITQVKNIIGDFRQNEILKSWEKFGVEYKDKEFIKIKIKISCSSGTYVRRIADDLGGFAYTIKRIKLGDITEADCLKII